MHVRKLGLKALLVGLLLVVLVIGGCGGSKEKSESPASGNNESSASGQKFKVAAILPGPVNDGSWNASAFNGLKLAEKELGVEIAYRESVPQSDVEEAFRGYASQGFNVIIGHGFEFGDAAKKVAKEFPKTVFLITDSNIYQEPNVGSYSVLAKQAGFLGGAAAALASKTGKVGIVGGLSIPPVKDTVEGFLKGAKYANPQVQPISAITGTSDDVNKNKETARAMLEQGVDVIMHNANQAGLGVIQVAREKKALAIGITEDQSSIAPDTVLVSAVRKVPEGIVYLIKQVKDGNFKAQFYPLGVKENVVGLVWNPALQAKMPPGAQTKLETIIKDLQDGKIDIDKLPLPK